MTTVIETLTHEQADAIVDGRHARQLVSEHRWYDKYLIVFGDIGGHYGFYYMEPATEMQDGQDVYESDPVEVFRVEGKTVEHIEWSVV